MDLLIYTTRAYIYSNADFLPSLLVTAAAAAAVGCVYDFFFILYYYSLSSKIYNHTIYCMYIYTI